MSPPASPSGREAGGARLDWVRTVVDDGWHNAVTDLARWRGELWLCHRRAERHDVFPPGAIVVLASADGERWEERAVLATGQDDRDPKLVPDGGRLRVYWGATVCERDGAGGPPRAGGARRVESCCAWTDDGREWTAPRRVVEAGWWLWRVLREDDGWLGLAYGAPLAGRPAELGELGERAMEVRLLRSADGLAWEPAATLLQGGRGSEGALHRASPTRLQAVVRGHGETFWMESEDPEGRFERWTERRIPHWMHAPAVLPLDPRRPDGALLAAGRDRAAEPEGGEARDYRTCLWHLEGGRTRKLLTLPSGGDTSYCGLVHDDQGGDGGVLVSYYSQHLHRDRPDFRLGERPASIHLARVLPGPG